MSTLTGSGSRCSSAPALLFYSAGALTGLNLAGVALVHPREAGPSRHIPPFLKDALRQIDGLPAGKNFSLSLPASPELPESVRLEACALPGQAAAWILHLHPGGGVGTGTHRQLERLAGAGILAASFAHEIRNGLTAGKAFIDVLLENSPDLEVAGLIQRDLKRIESLTTQMLRMASPAPREHRVLSIHAALTECVRLLQPKLDHKSIRLDQNLMATSDRIHGSELDLHQAFLNLLLNGIEAVPQGGEIRLETSLETALNGRKELLLVLEDNGLGIPQESLNQLFDPFFTTKSGGTGLGLTITRAIIQDHGGSITACNRLQAGARFETRLPVEQTGT